MANPFKNQSVEELKKALAEKRAAWKNFRFNLAGSKSANVKEARSLRKDIARILTVLPK